MVLIFSDIHGNREAAKQVQQLARGCTDVLFCGDVCGYGKDFGYCIDMFIDLGIKAVLGNHDRLVIDNRMDLNFYSKEVRDPIQYTKDNISTKHLQYLYQLPGAVTVNDIYLTHTYGYDQYVTCPEDCFGLVKKTYKKIIAIGHTHIQCDMMLGDVRIINPGSITKGRKGKNRGYVLLEDDRFRFVTCEDVI